MLIFIIKVLVTLIIGVLCGLAGAYAGAEGTSKAIRKFGIPIVLTIVSLLVLKHFGTLSVLLMCLAFIPGYGIPCWNDEGSLIGKFWYNLLKKYADFLSELETQKYASILTRSTIAKIVNLTIISIPIIRENWITYGLCCISIILVYARLSWRGLGNFKFLGKDLTISEFVTYLAIGLGVLITVFF